MLGLTGLLKSILFTGMLLIINKTISQSPLPIMMGYEWELYLAVIILSFVCTRYFHVGMVKVSNKLLYTLETTLIKSVQNTSFENFEHLGSQRIHTAMTDIRTLGQIPELVLNIFNSLIIICCGLIYLFWISWMGGILLLLLLSSLMTFYTLRNKPIVADMNAARDLQNDYYRYLRDLIDGFKEIKISKKRSETLEKYFDANRYQGYILGLRTSIKFITNDLMGNYSWYVVIGALLFALPAITGLSQANVTTYVVTIMFFITPTAVLVTTIPNITRIKIALERVDELEEILRVANEPSMGKETNLVENIGFDGLEFKDVSYKYRDNGRRDVFTLGPLSIKISKGEIIFVTGGNGSGKSTFINLLTGLYQPTEGKIVTSNGRAIQAYNEILPDQLSAIFTNNYLFTENYDQFSLKSENDRLNEYLDLMELSEVVKINDARNHIDSRLSKGQQKRLAMVYALLENKDLLILDEWAAEQDPYFRSFFYTVFLPKIKAIGKTVVAVTHDDRYFSYADRVIKLEYGEIIEDTSIIKNVNTF